MSERDIMRSTARGFQKYYNPEVGDMLRMDTNTNVFGGNPAAEKFVRKYHGDLNEYPNTYADGLRDALAELYGLERENFVAGSGSDEMLDVIFKTFSEFNDTSTIPVPSYVLYDYFIKMNGGNTRFVDLTKDFDLDVDALLREKSKIMLIPSPNNPTGNAFFKKDFEEILSRYDGILVIDEAYAEYGGQSLIKQVNEFKNLVIIRTFSKAYAMAALRVGYAVSNPRIAEMMNCVKIPYSLNALSEGAAIAAVKDQEFIRKSVSMVECQRVFLRRGLKRLGFKTFHSDANFMLAEAPIGHEQLVSGLKKKGILIRDFGDKRRTENCVRMTVGTRRVNIRLLEKIEEVIDEC